jgi:hypothetical protein
MALRMSKLDDNFDRLVLALERLGAYLEAQGLSPRNYALGEKDRNDGLPLYPSSVASPPSLLKQQWIHSLMTTLPQEVGTGQAAKILGVSKDTVLEYRARGVLPFRNTAPPGSVSPKFSLPFTH